MGIHSVDALFCALFCQDAVFYWRMCLKCLAFFEGLWYNVHKTDKGDFKIPENLFIIATMNPMIGKESIDYAWFRRFTVIEMHADDCYFDLTDVKFDKSIENIVTIKLVTLNFNTYSVNPNVSYKFKY